MTYQLLVVHRKRAGLTQKDVGEYIGISSQAVSKWENGQSEPDIATLCKLAELYKVSVDELVGKEAVKADNREGEELPTPEQKPSAFKEALIKYKKKIILAAAALIIVVAAILVGASVWKATEDDRMLKKFEQIELGMTKAQVEELLGEAEETFKSKLSGVSALDAVTEQEYGYADAEFWYYRGAEYDKNVDKFESLDLEYEFEPYYQLRIAFDNTGKVIEAYFNAEMMFTLLNDYGSDEGKDPESIQYFDEKGKTTTKTEDAATANIRFKDGSVYLGKVEVGIDRTTKKLSVKHPWGIDPIEE